MKKALLILALLAMGYRGSAQGLGEWFNQKKTQLKRLAEQIAALQAQIGILRKGYDIAGDGLGLLGNIKRGDLDQHSGYFTGLRLASAAVRSYPKTRELVRLYRQLALCADETAKIIRTACWLSAGEIDYLGRVLRRVKQDSEQAAKEFEQVLASDNYSLKDEERLIRIDLIHGRLLSCYRFLNSFNSGVRQLIRQRTEADHENNKFRSLYNH